jgi:hypothetical protein
VDFNVAETLKSCRVRLIIAIGINLMVYPRARVPRTVFGKTLLRRQDLGELVGEKKVGFVTDKGTQTNWQSKRFFLAFMVVGLQNG